MTRYERGFMNKCAELGRDPGAVSEFAMRKRAFLDSLPKAGVNNAAMGAVLGGLGGLAGTAFSSDDRKSYLKNALLYALLGGAAGLASGYLGAPDMWRKTKPYVNKAVNGVKGMFGVKSGAAEPTPEEYKRRRAMLKKMLLGLLGAGIGASHGSQSSLGSLPGALIGGAAGYGIGHLSNKLNEYAGADPLLRTVAVAK